MTKRVITDLQKCCACFACFNVCPKECIELKKMKMEQCILKSMKKMY